MSEAGPVRLEVRRRMWEVIATAIATRSMSVQEAAAEARGLGRGLEPALPSEIVAAAVTEMLRELGSYQPPLERQNAAGIILSPADPAEVVDSLSYAMRFDERSKTRRTGVEYATTLAAETLVRRLQAIRYVVMWRCAAAAHRPLTET